MVITYFETSLTKLTLWILWKKLIKYCEKPLWGIKCVPKLKEQIFTVTPA
jgi:hypothetical protein